MALVTVLAIGTGDLIGETAEAVARGARVHSNIATVHQLDPADDGLSQALADDLRDCVGVAIGSSLTPARTEERMTNIYELTGASSDHDRLGIRVATTFSSLAKDDPNSAETVERMNRLLYRWGAVIVSPGSVEPVVDWLDNTPGIETRADENTALAPTSIAAAERQGRRLGSLVGIIARALAQQARLGL
jgi:NAD(P)H dehydrogenase (quinone)